MAERFEFYFTPKSAGWLNMIEIEFSAYFRLCLPHRISTLELLECEFPAQVAERKAYGIKITWQFSVHSAQTKLRSHYVKVQPDSLKFKET